MELMVTAGFGESVGEGAFGCSVGLTELPGEMDAWMRWRLQTRRAAQFLVSSMVARGLESKDHCERVARWSRTLARELGLSRERIFDVELGALLHDVGYLRLNMKELWRPGTDEHGPLEFTRHAEFGALLLAQFPALRRAVPLVVSHHERFDGSGYPYGKSGVAIPLDGRIFHVVDAYDALTKENGNRAALSDQEAREELTRGAGTRFDPVVTRALCSIDPGKWRSPGSHPTP